MSAPQMEVAYRPSHADATYDFKYGIRAVAGGGRSSARETIGRVAAGAVAKKLLSLLAPGCEVRPSPTPHPLSRGPPLCGPPCPVSLSEVGADREALPAV